MKYRNSKTGAIINVKSKISGGNWQAIEPVSSSDIKKKAPPRKKKGIKEDG